jgi:hypothetical protein
VESLRFDLSSVCHDAVEVLFGDICTTTQYMYSLPGSAGLLPHITDYPASQSFAMHFLSDNSRVFSFVISFH